MTNEAIPEGYLSICPLRVCFRWLGTEDNQLYGWGENSCGQLGLPACPYVVMPTLVPGSTAWKVLTHMLRVLCQLSLGLSNWMLSLSLCVCVCVPIRIGQVSAHGSWGSAVVVCCQ